MPQDIIESLIYLTVLSGSMRHLPLRDAVTGRWFAVEDAAVLARPVSAAAVAQSLMIPHTTVRRRCAAMVVQDQLIRGRGGFRPLLPIVARRYAQDGATHFKHVLESLSEAGYEPARLALAVGVATLPPGVIQRLINTFQLRTIELLVSLYGDVANAIVAGEITAANVQSITDDAELARRYAGEDELPPDELRQPIPVRELARRLGQPFETVRRRVAALVERELVFRCEQGVLVPAHVLSGPRITDYNRRSIGFLEQMLETMVAAVAIR